MSVATSNGTALRRQTVRGGLVTAVGTWARFAIQFGTVVAIARMLGPEQYGIAAIVLVFATLAELIRTSGVVNAVIQRSDLTPARAATLHWFCCAVGATIGVAGAALYLVVGGTPANGLLFAVLVLSAGVGAVPAALLIRDMRTGRLIGCELAAATASCGLAVGLVLAGAGSAALVWQAASSGVLTALLVTSAGGFRPRGHTRLSDVRPYLSFGAHSALTQGTRFVAQNSDRVLVSMTAPAAQAGMYVQANQLVTLPLAQVTGPLHRVVLPALSRSQDDPVAFRSYFRGTAATMSLILFPVFAVLAVVAEPLITTLFGPEWIGSVPLFQVLALNGAGAALVFLSSWVFVATGRARTQSLLTLATSATTVASVLIGSAFGPAGIAAGVAAASILAIMPAFLIARRGTGLGVRDLISPLIPGAAVAATVSIATAAAVAAAPGGAAISLACGLGASIATYVAAVATIPAARRRVRHFISLTRSRPDGNDLDSKETT